MSFSKTLLILGVFICFQIACANQKILHPSHKIGFDINALDKDGLMGEANAVSYTHLTLPTTPYV